MTLTAYTEDTLVQQTTADYLEHQPGWESVYACNREDFGPDSLLGRISDREGVLARTLRERLRALNPGLPEAAYAEAVRQLTITMTSQTLVATNREQYALIRDGVQVSFRNTKDELVWERLRVFDFDEPTNNHFLGVRELWVRGDLYRRRAVEDRATVPLYYDARGDALGVAVGDLNERMADKAGCTGNRRHRHRATAGTGTEA